MQWILDHPAEAEDMGQRGRKAVEKYYSWETEAEKLVTLYKKTAAGPCVIIIQLDSVSPIHTESSYYLFHQGGYVSEYHDRYIAFFR